MSSALSFPPLLLLLTSDILPAAKPSPPQVLPPGWEVSLFASEPEIVMPIRIAVDKKGKGGRTKYLQEMPKGGRAYSS